MKTQKLFYDESTADLLLFVSLIYMFFSLFFARSFVGIYVAGFRLGEIFMLLSLVLFLYFLFLKIKN